jgi:ATP-dependent exoDNAse (exonuclease V) alpha subunit
MAQSQVAPAADKSLRVSYAVSIHKSPGSDNSAVVITPLDP